MSSFLVFFYRLPLEFIAQSFFLLSLVYLCVWQRFSHCRWLRRGICVTLTVWIAASLWITIFNRSPGAAYPLELIPFHSYRKLFTTGSNEVIRTNFMNVALFYPAGLLTASLLPKKWPRSQKMLSVGIAWALFSLMIEYVQFCSALGEPEIDDVIHNTLGALLGTLPIVFHDLLHKPAG